jgi:sensor histidine kinase YesM
VNIEKGLNSNMLVPAMLVQPYVENALKHGISKIKEQGRIDISFSRAENGWLKATIADNGPGLPALKDPDQRTHMGMRLSAGRANSYNQLFQLRIKVSTGTPSTGPGTIVNILIPPISDENSKVPNADH